MKHFLSGVLAALLCTSAVHAQIVPSNGVARRFIVGATLPVTCAVGDVYYRTSGSPGQYNCTATNTWSIVATGSAGLSGSISANQIAYGTGVDTLGGNAGFLINTTLVGTDDYPVPFSIIRTGITAGMGDFPGLSSAIIKMESDDPTIYSVSGLTINLKQSSTVAGNGTQGFGVNANYFGNSATAHVYGGVFSTINLDMGAVGDIIAIKTFAGNEGGGTAANVIGAYLEADGGGTATSVTALKILDVAGGSTNRAIETGAGDIVFGSLASHANQILFPDSAGKLGGNAGFTFDPTGNGGAPLLIVTESDQNYFTLSRETDHALLSFQSIVLPGTDFASLLTVGDRPHGGFFLSGYESISSGIYTEIQNTPATGLTLQSGDKDWVDTTILTINAAGMTVTSTYGSMPSVATALTIGDVTGGTTNNALKTGTGEVNFHSGGFSFDSADDSLTAHTIKSAGDLVNSIGSPASAFFTVYTSTIANNYVGMVPNYLTLTSSEDGAMTFSTIEIHGATGILIDPNPVTTTYVTSDLQVVAIGHGGAWKDVHAANFVMESSALRTDTTDAHTGAVQGYDVNDATYRSILSWTNGNAVAAALATPSGGTLAIDATSYKIGGVTPITVCTAGVIKVSSGIVMDFGALVTC